MTKLYTEYEITDLKHPFEHLTYGQYLKKRVQFWKYRLKHTMGRSVLILWKPKQ
jgi:hypothetical protein